MNIEFEFGTANDYAKHLGAEIYHPHVSIIHYDEVGEIHHTINRYNVYALFLQKEFPDSLTYGVGMYKQRDGSLMAYSPGQVGGQADDGTVRQYHGWVLIFDNDFISGTEIERRMSDYHFFSYNANEALYLTDGEKEILRTLMENIRGELANHKEEVESEVIVHDLVKLVLDYCLRFYSRQFKDVTTGDNDILTRFQDVLTDYYKNRLQYKNGVPSVAYCASELFLSASYFGDLIRQMIGQTPRDYIRGFIISKAKNLLLSGKNVTETADELGFEYPQHFNRVFKKTTGMPPLKFVESSRK